MSRRTWLIISKPLRPPFRDGSTVLARDLVRHLPAGRRVAHLGDPRAPLRADADVIAAPPAGYAPTLGDKLRALLAMLLRPRHPVHLLFTPGGATAAVLRWIRRLQPRRLLVQSLMSSHGAEGWAPLLRPLSAVVALSEHTAGRLRAAGVAAERVAVIRPAVAAAPADDPTAVAARRRLLYAGDLDPPIAARLTALARALASPDLAGWSLTIACRPKADGDADARAQLRRDLPGELASGRVELLAEVDDMDALMRRASLQLYAAEHTHRKVDLPLALLEGLARGLPVALVDAAPASELLKVAPDLPAGALVPAAPDEFARAVAEACRSAPLADWSAAALALAGREFSLPAMAARYDALYAALEAGHPLP